eukprot:84428_1
MAAELGRVDTVDSDQLPFLTHNEEQSITFVGKCKSKKLVISAVALLVAIIATFLVLFFVLRYEKTSESGNQCRYPLVVAAFDGFRWDYVTNEYQSQYDIDLIHFRRLMSSGAHIKQLQPVFPTLTYPNFYTLTTGLYPGSHGIPWNTFYDRKLDAIGGEPIDDDPTGKWWLRNPIWTTIQDNMPPLKSALVCWIAGRANNNFNGNNDGHADWYLKKWDEYLDLNVRSDILLNATNRTHYDLSMVYFNEPDATGHKYGPNSHEMAAMLQHCDDVLGYLVNGLNTIYGDGNYNLIVVSDHGFAECVIPSPLILDMTLLDGYFENKSLYFDTTAPQLGIKIDYEMFEIVTNRSVDEYVVDLLLDSIVDVANYKNDLFSIYKKGEVPYELNGGSLGYRLSDIVVDVKVGYEWNIVGSTKYNRNVSCAGGHGWNNTLRQMQATLIGVGPNFKRNYSKDEADSVDVYELMCKLLGNTEPQPNNGSLENIQDILRYL